MSDADTVVARPVGGAEGGGQGAGGGLVLRGAKFVLALVLLPLCVGLAVGFHEYFDDVGARLRLLGGAWPKGLRAFVAGAGSFGVLAILLWRPVTVYVFGHEVVHAVATWLCGGKVGNLHASASGGQVSTSKSNTFIRLAPYCIPLYTVLVALSFAALNAWWRPLDEYRWVLGCLLGFTLAFHLGFTLWSLRRGQPDLKPDGWFFSLTLIFLANLLVVGAVVGLALSGKPLGAWEAVRGVWQSGWEHSLALYRDLLLAARHAWSG